MRWFFYLVKFIFFLPSRIVYPIKVIGKKRLPKQNYVSVTNHLCAKDVFLLAFYLSGFRHYLAKKELSKKRFIGTFLRMLGAVYIDRNNLDLKGIKTSIACLKKAPLSIFPEGTRNHEDESMKQIKGGAAMIAVKADAEIVPVMIHHRTRAFRRNYIFVGESFKPDYTSKDRFNSEAMAATIALITDKMLETKQTLDHLIATKSYKAYNKQLKKDIKAAKKQQKNQDVNNSDSQSMENEGSLGGESKD